MIKTIANAKRVAFQGEPGAYANLAAREAVPHAAAIPKPTFEDAIEAAKSGDTDLVIIPVENSLIGRIADIHHLLPESGLHIVGEHFLPIHHQLLGLKDATLEGIKTLYSQAPALAQNTLKLLVERSRGGYIESVAREYRAMLDQKVGRVRAKVTSAVPLDEAALGKIRSQLTQLTQKQVSLESVVDPKVLGGVVAQVGSLTFDGSLQTQLEGLKRQLLS